MNNTSTSLKRFLANKNTVTILGTLVMIFVIYIGYNARVNAAIQPQMVPYATQTIQPRTKITADMVGEMQVPLSIVKGRENLIMDKNQLIGRYTNVNSLIPKYSMFFEELVLDRSELPDVAVLEVKDGQVLFNLPVSITTTYGNSMYPGNYFDIYFKSLDESKKIQYGKLISNVKILAVKDGNGHNVFENSEEFKTPSMLIFAVPADMNLILRKALYLEDFEAELLPVPVKEVSNKKLQTSLVSNYLASFINAKTVNVPIDEILSKTDNQVSTDVTDNTTTSEEVTN